MMQFPGRNKHQGRSRYEESTTNNKKRQGQEGKGSGREGFPNVIGEAMACGVPCVVTNVGDSALIVANTGKVVPPKDPQSLAGAWQELIELKIDQRQAIGRLARQRIAEHFSLDKTVYKYETLYKKTINQG